MNSYTKDRHTTPSCRISQAVFSRPVSLWKTSSVAGSQGSDEAGHDYRTEVTVQPFPQTVSIVIRMQIHVFALHTAP